MEDILKLMNLDWTHYEKESLFNFLSNFRDFIPRKLLLYYSFLAFFPISVLIQNFAGLIQNVDKKILKKLKSPKITKIEKDLFYECFNITDDNLGVDFTNVIFIFLSENEQKFISKKKLLSLINTEEINEFCFMELLKEQFYYLLKSKHINLFYFLKKNSFGE